MNKFAELHKRMIDLQREVSECIMPLDYPLTKEQEEKLVAAKDSIHIIPGAFPLNFQGLCTLLNVCKVIEEREGIRGKDYVICIHDLNGDKKLVVDTTNSFFCNEDSI